MRKKILVIEDDRTVAKLLEDALTREGHEVKLEIDGEWGARTFEAKGADLIILDVLVPNLIGFDVVREIRKTQKGKAVPIIMLSGVYSAAGHKKKMVEEFDVIDYLDKPVDLRNLLPLVKAVLSGAQRPVPTLPPAATSHLTEDGKDVAPDLSTLFQGNLENISFAQLLGMAHGARASGALMLRKSSVKKIVYLQGGTPVFVKSNLIEETLGRIMLKERLITPGENEKAIDRMKREGRKQGEILVEMGAISPHNLEFALERQLEVKLYDLFTWLEGKYLLNDRTEYEGTHVALSSSPIELIYEGVRRSMSPERISRELQKIHERIVVPSRDSTMRHQARQLEPDSDLLLDLVDGRRTVGQLVRLSKLERGATALLLYTLISSTLLSLVDEALPAEVVKPRLERLHSEVPGRPSGTELISVDTDDMEPLRTGEVSTDTEEIAIMKAAREKARREAEEAAPQLFDEAAREEAEVSREADEAELSDEIPIPSPALEPASPVVRELPEPPPAPAVGAPPAEESPLGKDPARFVLSEEVRAQIRSRLEAEAESLATKLPSRASAPPAKRPSMPVMAPEARALIERDLERLRKELTEAVRNYGQRNYFERLGLHRHSPDSEVEPAFERVKREVADRYALPQHATFEIRLLYEELMLLLRRARDGLVHPVERQEYGHRLGGKELAERGLAKMHLAELAFKEGLALFRREDFRAARGQFEIATALAPEEGIYLAYRAFSSYSAENDDSSARRALEDLERAQDLAPRLDRAYVFAALLHEHLDARDQAIENMKKALGCNPDCVEALGAMKAWIPEPEKKSGFLRMFTS